MQTTLRKIGNSRGIIIPSAFIEQLHFEHDVEIRLHHDGLFVKPIRSYRQGWFDGYDSALDEDLLADLKDLDSEQEDWVW
jgi:antitoxin MazE